MIRGLAGTAAALMATGLSLGAAGAAEIHTFNVNNWKGGAYTNDQSGAFSHCAARADYKSGITLLFVVNKDYEWAMAFNNSNWNLQTGTTFPVRYQIDRGAIRNGTANVIGKDLVRVALPDSTDLFNDFRRGNNLAIQGGSEVLNFRLTDTSAMLNAVLACARDFRSRAMAPPSIAPTTPSLAPGGTPSLAPGGNAARPQGEGSFFGFNPPPQNQPGTMPPPGQPPQTAFFNQPAQPSARPGTTAAELRIEAGNIAVSMLNRGGMTGYRMLTPAEAPGPVKEHHAVWSLDGLIGTMRVLGSETGLNLEQIRGQLLSSDSASCKGKFASGVAPDQGRPQTISLFTQCEGETEFSAFYIAVPRSSGGFYLLSVVGGRDKGETVQQASGAYRTAVFQTIP
jgi:hypothetical protein